MSVTPVDGLTPVETSYLSERIHQIGFPDRQRKQNAKVFLKDAPEFDQRWLNRLLGETGPTIRDFDNALWQAFAHEMGSLAPGRLHHAYKNMVRHKTAHRAGDDAAHLCYAWRAGLGRRSTSR